MYSDLENLYAVLLDRTFQVALFGAIEGFQGSESGYIAHCPFHSESLPSLLIHGARPGYFCFVCGARGDWIDYLLRHNKAVSFRDALARLEAETGTRCSTDEEAWRSELLLSEMHEAIQTLSIAELWSLSGMEARAYLADRGYTQEEIEGMGLGLLPATHSLLEHLGAEFPLPMAEAMTGHMAAACGDQSCLTIPYRDASGRLMGFYGRSITGQGPAAYRPLTDMKRLQQVPFLMHRARGCARIVVVQGFLDALLAIQIGIKGVVGVGQTGLTPDYLATAVRYGAGRFLLALDSVDATVQAIERIHAAGLEAQVVNRPEKYPDTDAYIRDSCINKFGKLLEKTIPAEEWLSRHPG